MADQSDMIRKVQAALALAGDAGATDEERKHAQAVAERLMAKYEIDEAMMYVEAKGTSKEKDVVMTSFFIMGSGEKFIPQQRLVLVSRLAENFSCRAVIEEKYGSADPDSGAPLPGGTYISIMGFRTDADAVRSLYTLLVTDLALSIAREKQTAPNYVKQFAEGYVERIASRLKEMRRNVTKAVEESGTGMSLVLVEKSALVKSKFDEQFPNLRPYSGVGDRSKYDPNARARGAKAAEAADLGGHGRGKVGGGARRGIGG